MKKTAILFTALLALLFTLTACHDTARGRSGGDAGVYHGGGTAGSGSVDGSVTEGSGALGNGALAQAWRAGNYVDESIHDGFNEVGNATDYNGGAMTRFEMMLDNARVRDRDGILFDGENPRHNTFF